jgi:hypothetical protein
MSGENRPDRPAPQDAPRLPPERLRYLAGCVHGLGPRALYELFRELEAGAPLAERLERYCGLKPLGPFIDHVAGRGLPPARLVRGARR